MRLAKSIEMALGLVASGGVALMLSGSAYAADGVVGTISQSTSDISTISSEAVVSVTATTENAKSSEPVSGNNNVIKAEASIAVPSATNSDTVTKSDISTVTSATASTTTSTSDGTKSKVSAAKQVTIPTVQNKSIKTEFPADASATQPLTTESSTASGQPVALSDPEASTVTVGSRVLEIQPKITASRPMPVQDLAAYVPTAADQGHTTPAMPEPAKSTGLFSRLTAELAGTVVPAHVDAPLTSSTPMLLMIVSLISAIVLVGFAGLNFGASLRQGGYVHAPRSDVADNFFSLSFATPMSLSFVTANQPIPSSFLMVSENKTESILVSNAIRKEEMK